MKMRISLRLFVLACLLWVGVLQALFSSCLHVSISTFQFSTAQAQTFTEHLTRSKSGEASVILHHDAEIEALVNGHKVPASTPSSPAHQQGSLPDAGITHADTLSGAGALPGQQISQGRRLKTNGYRIQVYAGGNNRQSKGEAYRMAGLVRSTFSELPVYTNFISPRWTCRVGDFRTREEAVDMLRRMRETHKFREATIVKSQIVLLY